MKRLTSLRMTLLASVVVLVLAACGGEETTTTEGSASGQETTSTEGSASGEETTTTESSPEVPPDIEGELIVWHYFPEDSSAVVALNANIELFNEIYPNVTVKLESFPFDQLTTKVLTAAGGGDGPDVLMYNHGDLARLVDANALVSLDAYWSEWDEASAFPDSVVYSVDGARFAVQGYVNLLAMWYNADILKELGVEPPSTLEELEAAMLVATEAGYTGITTEQGPGGVAGWWNGMPYMTANCVGIEMDDQDRIERALVQMRSWIDNGYMRPDVVTISQSDATSQWLTGEFAFLMTGNWEINSIAEAASFEYGTIQVPAGECPSSVFLGGEANSLGAFGGQPDLAWEFLRLGPLSKVGGELFLENVGGIPTRSDADFAGSAVLQAYSDAIAAGQPIPFLPGEAAAQARFGDLYSASLAGQFTPEEAAKMIFEETPDLLATE